MTRNVLLFPALLLEAVRIKVLAAERGETVIAAATDADESGLALFPQQRVLPHITSPDFGSALGELIERERIAHVYCPHARCYHAISVFLQQSGLPVTLSNGMQQLHTALIHDQLRALAAPLHADYAKRAMRNPILPLDHLVAFLHTVTPIAGQSHFLKLATLGCVAADFPEGDCVEIGVAAGRSAVLLKLLTQYFRCGVFVGVDPWTNMAIKQDIKSLDDKMLVDNAVWERGVETLRLTLLPYAKQDLAFLRMTSVDAHALYQRQRLVGEPPLGPVITAGKIAVLHVDGNHTEAKAAEDLALWTPYLVPGAWLVVDDYGWAYGDGPKRATDAWIEQNRQRIAEFFVADRAMFIKMR